MAARQPKRASSAKPAKKNLAKKSQRAGAKTPPLKKVEAKKVGPKPAPAKKSVAKKSVAKKSVAKKSVAKKSIAKKSVPKKSVPKKGVPKKGPVETGVAKSTPARDALSALAQKRAIKATLGPAVDGKEVVDGYMRDVDHPFKAEMQAVRQIIVGASPKISERIKWNAPSFYYKEDLGAFNPRATEYAHLILLFPGGGGMQDDAGLLEGNHKDRREAKFHSISDVNAKKPALEKLIKRWVTLRDR